MTLKIKVFENNKEKIISVDKVLGRETRKVERHTIDLPLKTNKTITLEETPVVDSDFVTMNGLVLTNDITCDYTITGNVLTFNNTVITSSGAITIRYYYLTDIT